MKTVSKISSAPRNGRTKSAAGAGASPSIWQRRQRLREEYATVIPPRPRRRIREARHWLYVLDVRSSNGRVCERVPGAHYITLAEGAEIQTRGLRELEAHDPELFKAASWVMRTSLIEDLDISLEEWKVQAIRRQRRRSKVRAEMHRTSSI